jgi:tetratricopeptide (TPR) repeat protein
MRGSVAGRVAVSVLALTALAVPALRAQIAPRDIWPQATAAAREGDFDLAAKRTNELLNLGRSYGIKTFPLYAASASGLASETSREKPELAAWAAKAAEQLDGSAPSVMFSEADRAAARDDWPAALPLAMQGYVRMLSNDRTSLLGRADMLLMAVLAVFATAIVMAIALFFRYGRSMAHDFREMLSRRMSGGSVSVLAFALLFLPIFFWLGPLWLMFYWLAIFFGYASPAERAIIVILLLLVALLPIAADAAANWIAGVESPVVMAAISSNTQGYQPDALRRLQELIAVVPDNAMLHLLMGNMQAFEGVDDQAALHYRRAIELRPNHAGAHVNRGNLHFLNNEFQAAITEYEKAQRADPKLAIAFYNHSVAAGETYKFDQQAQMLDKARQADRNFVERTTRNLPPQKVVMYHPPISEAWDVTRALTKRSAARALFGNYSRFDPSTSAFNPVTIGALLSLLLALLLWVKRRRTGFANACIKCGRTFCPRCKSARESATYCTQCIHIYLKRDGVSLDTKRQKLEEVSDHQSGMVRRNRLFATFLPGAAQMMEGRTIKGTIGIFFFVLFVAIAVFVGRLAPALGPVAEVAQLIVRVAAIALAVIIWILMSIPVYRRRLAV